MSTLTEKLAQYRSLMDQAQALEGEIVADVMLLGKTLTAGGVKAAYSNGRGSYDYEGAAKAGQASPELVALFTTQPEPPPPKTDWRGLCQHLNLDLKPYFTPGLPTVKLSLEG